MLLSDPISQLFQINKPPQTIENIKEPQDPNYFYDLKKHLQQNPTYRQERKEFYKLRPGWSLFRARDEFAREYSELFHQDIECFCRVDAHVDAGEAAQAFCLKYRGYLNMYGVEWTERAIRRCKQ